MYEMTKEKETRFVVVTGGVCSSIGKGILVSSLGILLKSAGYSISVVKWDPYLNVDSGTMSPLEHGEVFVTDDGGETDLDLGHYERFLDVSLDKSSSLTSGKLFNEILRKERAGAFLGRCIQLVPHAVDMIKQYLFSLASSKQADVVLIEIGGTVGDIEGEVFLETIRQLKRELPVGMMTLCHLSYVPYLGWANEVKTKPTQHSVMLMKKAGIIPDALFLRTDFDVSDAIKSKVSLFCDVDKEAVFQLKTYPIIYKVFDSLNEQGVGEVVQKLMGIQSPKKANLSEWNALIDLIQDAEKEVRIGIIVKYHGSNDPYISVIEAMKSASYAVKVRLVIEYIEAESLENGDKKALDILHAVDGIIVPGGFDKRGFEGKVVATKWARNNKKPFLGLCLGMQVMLVEAARSLCNFKGASSTEIDPTTEYPIVSMLDEQQVVRVKGASMRLGAYKCTVVSGTRAYDAYQKNIVQERHRHRYEFNNLYRKSLEAAGVQFSGFYEKHDLVEISEIKDHPFMIGVQFHPEFLSRPLKPHPLFLEFFKTVVAQKK
ncbi:CTP synthase [Candidatus Babeliales bacterium]|nr:CTP synthase [Candidatus Babeliales bacterium]